mmetsp:Transcript_9829/g.16091  ORF Transcript_9829/g.16091 Transcript_9829/m.16091 type:complete len:265 (+) Transcript_9829:340-1134(+)
MRDHARVQRGPAGNKSTFFCIILPPDHPHILGHGISMKPWRAKRMLHGHPARGKDDKISNSNTWHSRWTRQNCVDTWIRVVVRHRVHAAKLAQVILVRNIVAMVGNNIVGRKMLRHFKHIPSILYITHPFLLFILKVCNRGFKVLRVGKPIGTNRPKIRKNKMSLEYFQNIPTIRLGLYIDRETHTTLNHTNLIRFHAHDPKLRLNTQHPSLGNNQKITIRVGKRPLTHTLIYTIRVNRQTAFGLWITTLPNRSDPLNKIHLFI